MISNEQKAHDIAIAILPEMFKLRMETRKNEFNSLKAESSVVTFNEVIELYQKSYEEFFQSLNHQDKNL